MNFWLSFIDGTLAYPGAERGPQVATSSYPPWRALMGMAIDWTVMTPALAWLARRSNASSPLAPPSTQGASA